MRSAAVAAASLVLLVLPATAGAQERLCNINAPGRTENTGDQVIVLHDPFTVMCDDGAQLRANSGRLYETTSELELTGDVYFEDADRTLTAREATYDRVAGRLFAQGDVVFHNRVEGSTLRGPELEYFRENEERPLAQVLATQRPELTIEPEEDDPGGEPLLVVADRLLILGDDDLSAFDSVVITRSDMRATSAEARYNSTTEDLELRGDAVIVSEEYTLSGEVIQATLTDGSLEQVHARNRARVEGEDMYVEAPDLQLFFAADTLRRAVAVAPRDAEDPTQALARSANFELTADSIDASFIDQKIREVYAVGSARAETSDTTARTVAFADADSVAAATAPAPADTTSGAVALADPDSLAANPEAAPADSTSGGMVPVPPVLDADWVRGDTVIGYFEPVVPAEPADSVVIAAAGEAAEDEAVDPGGDVELRRLVAIGSAQSLYRMAPENDPGSTQRNVNFLVGARIELDLVDGELSVASVKGLERGIYLEATADPPPVADEPSPIDPAVDADPAAPSLQGLG